MAQWTTITLVMSMHHPERSDRKGHFGKHGIGGARMHHQGRDVSKDQSESHVSVNVNMNERESNRNILRFAPENKLLLPSEGNSLVWYDQRSIIPLTKPGLATYALHIL